MRKQVSYKSESNIGKQGEENSHWILRAALVTPAVLCADSKQNATNWDGPSSSSTAKAEKESKVIIVTRPTPLGARRGGPTRKTHRHRRGAFTEAPRQKLVKSLKGRRHQDVCWENEEHRSTQAHRQPTVPAVASSHSWTKHGGCGWSLCNYDTGVNPPAKSWGRKIKLPLRWGPTCEWSTSRGLVTSSNHVQGRSGNDRHTDTNLNVNQPPSSRADDKSRSRARLEPVCNRTCEGGVVAQRAHSTATARVAGTNHSSLQYRRTPHLLRVNFDIVVDQEI